MPMAVGFHCRTCSDLLTDQDPPGGRCAACAWAKVRQALDLERRGAIAALGASLLLILAEAAFIVSCQVEMTASPGRLAARGPHLLAGLLALAGILAVATWLAPMVRALCLHCAVPPLVRLREPALAAVGCLTASGLALVAAGLVLLYAGHPMQPGWTPAILGWASLFFVFLAHVVHLVYLRRLATHSGNALLVGELTAFLAAMLLCVPVALFAGFALLQWWLPLILSGDGLVSSAGEAITVLALIGLIGQCPVPALLCWYRKLVTQVRAAVPQPTQERPESPPDLAPLPREEPLP